MNRRLSIEEQKGICEDYSLGIGYIELSKKYNICTWSIGNALKKNNIPSRIRKYECNENYFEKITTKEQAYWLGLLFADGYVRQRMQCEGKHKQGGVVGISLKDGDEYLIEHFLSDLRSNYNIYDVIKDGFLSHKVEINSSKLTKDLINHGCVPRKSLILKPPKINKNLISHFIRGYFDGDGSVGNYNNRLKFSLLGTREVLEWTALFLYKKSGIKIPKICKKENIHIVQYNRQNDIELIRNIIYNSCENHFLKRKKEIFFKK